MDSYARKKAIGGFGLSSRAASLAIRESNHEDRQCCNRLGCSTRFNSMNGPQPGKPDKSKYARGSFRSTSSKALAGSSTISLSASTDLGKPHRGRQDRTSPRVSSIGESSNRRGEIVDVDSSDGLEVTEDSDFISTGIGIQTLLPDSQDTTDNLSNSTTVSSSRSHKPISRRTASGNQDASSRSCFKHPSACRNTNQAAKPVPHGVKNLSCTSISNALSSGCSSSDFGRNKRVDTVRKRLFDGESSSSRGKCTGRPTSRGLSCSTHNGHCAPSLSLRGRSAQDQSSRRVKNQPASKDGVVSVRNQRPSTIETRTRAYERGDDDVLSLPEHITIPQLSQPRISAPGVMPESSSRSFPIELPPVLHNSFERPGSSSRAGRNWSTSRSDGRSTQIFSGPLGDRDGYRHSNMEGIAEVLLALERIEQDEELTYEQLLVLETNLFMGGLSFHDQHRDMRLDIDNMTYEELLALGEEMGTVSTALSEEELAKCLQRSIYMSASRVPGITDQGVDDFKCSICQEEYIVGDEVGKLECEHRYHIACIHQWLRLKNWCPICKASACSSA